MKLLNILSVVVAILLAAGEFARWWGDPRLIPLALDELVVASALLGAVIASARWGAAPLASAWGLFCGLVLSLLVPTLDHLLFGPPKNGAVFYSAILAIMLAAGLWAAARALAIACRPN